MRIRRLYPLFRTVTLSVTEWNGVSPNVKFVGVANFVAAFRHGVFWRGALNSVLFALVALTVMNGIGLLLALLVDSPRIRGSALYRAVYYIPPIMSPAVVAVLWKWIYHPYSGTLNNLLLAIGLGGLARGLAGAARDGTLGGLRRPAGPGGRRLRHLPHGRDEGRGRVAVHGQRGRRHDDLPDGPGVRPRHRGLRHPADPRHAGPCAARSRRCSSWTC